MPLPTRNKDEKSKDFVNRCMSSEVMKREYPDQEQRVAVCISKSQEGSSAEGLELASEELEYIEITKKVRGRKGIDQ